MIRRLFVWVTVLLAFVAALYLSLVTWLESTEVGLARNYVTGELWVHGPGGFYITPPWVFVAHIDTRPERVCITSTAHAPITCRLVRFEPHAYREFVATEGFRLYWWSNRLSFNWGYREEYRGFRDVLRGYAFGAVQYPFLIIEKQFEEDVVTN